MSNAHHRSHDGSMSRRPMRMVLSASLVTGLLLATGCESTGSSRQERMSRGYIYYCDGAGGGGIKSYEGGLKKGLIDAGYPGAGEVFRWNTGLGVVADQDSSVRYKRGKARQMADKAVAYSRQHPGAPVTFMGLSAGTSVVVFALEQLPANYAVDDVVLFGASISSTYDLTRALQHVKGNLYLFTSEHDSVLKFLVPMSGTADRASGTVPAAGLRGFRMPAGAPATTRRLYSKIVTIRWRPEFRELGYAGGHTDVLSPKFVQAHIAPLISTKVTPVAVASTEGKVRNPDYDRWAGFGVGSYVVMEGEQVHQGVRSKIRFKASLESKGEDRLLVKRGYYLGTGAPAIPDQMQAMIAPARIDPTEHPLTHPNAKIKDVPGKKFALKGRSFTCQGRSVTCDGSFSEWGSNVKAVVYQNQDFPGGAAGIWLESHLGGEKFTFEGKVVDYRIVRP